MKRSETIRITGLSTGYAGRHGSEVVVARDVDASLWSGELTCLLGPNGAGKSTLLKTLSGFLPPVAGTIMIEGRSLSDYRASDLGKVIGVVLTDKLSLQNMTAEELVALGRSPYTGFWGRLSTHDREVVDEAISLVGIGNLRHRMVQTLSDGERQKVMIAKALAQETPIIFLDEPTAFLDYPSKVEIMQLLQRLARERGKTVFLSTHDLELALQIADRVWLVDKTLGVRTGAPEDLALSGDLARFFSREGVRFDMKTGLFRIDSHPVRRMRVSGTGPRRGMVTKALARNNIEVCDEASIPGVIEIAGDIYIYGGSKTMSIADLMSAVVGM